MSSNPLWLLESCHQYSYTALCTYRESALQSSSPQRLRVELPEHQLIKYLQFLDLFNKQLQTEKAGQATNRRIAAYTEHNKTLTILYPLMQ